MYVSYYTSIWGWGTWKSVDLGTAVVFVITSIGLDKGYNLEFSHKAALGLGLGACRRERLALIPCLYLITLDNYQPL